MLIWKAWVHRPCGLIKMREEAQVLYMQSKRISLIEVENVSQKRISVINLYHYKIGMVT